MNLTERIKQVLATEKKKSFATAQLADGSGTITNGSEESFAVGQEVFMVVSDEVSENELVALPDGEFTTVDNLTLTVMGGVITELMEGEDGSATDTGETEMEKEELADTIKAALADALTPIIERIEKLENAGADVEEAVQEVAASVAKLSEQPAAPDFRTYSKEQTKKAMEVDIRKIENTTDRARIIAKRYSNA